MTTPLPTTYQPGDSYTAAAHNAENTRINENTAAIAAGGGGGGGLTAVDNGNGTITITGGSVVDNGNGTITI